jgi:hypothetical protein
MAEMSDKFYIDSVAIENKIRTRITLPGDAVVCFFQIETEPVAETGKILFNDFHHFRRRRDGTWILGNHFSMSLVREGQIFIQYLNVERFELASITFRKCYPSARISFVYDASVQRFRADSKGLE